LDYLFYDDNSNKSDSDFLNNFCKKNGWLLLESIKNDSSNYKDHNWDVKKIDRVISIKNMAIEYAVKHEYDYLFLVDADLVLHPMTLTHLVNQKEHFIFEVFWTLFFGESYHKPNAWDHHSWAYTGPETILKLTEKGKYIVGGGGACTLLSKEILSKKLSFDRLMSLAYQGEDRHFCTRAQALGYSVMVDTHYPAYHIFKTDQCSEAQKWYDNGADSDFFKIWLDENWKNKVLKSFEVKKKGLLMKLKRFQYEVRRLFIKTVWND